MLSNWFLLFEVQYNKKSNLYQLCDPCSYLQIKCYPGLIFRWYYKLVSTMRNSNPERTDNSEIIVTRVCKIIFVGMVVLVWVELEQKLDA